MAARGFTLVEVLIALVVFAVLGFTVAARVGDVVNQTFSLERRTVAHWVAGNHLSRLQIVSATSTDPVATGRNRDRVTLAGRDWLIETVISNTSQDTFKRVEIEVYELQEGEEVGPIETMTAFLGQY